MLVRLCVSVNLVDYTKYIHIYGQQNPGVYHEYDVDTREKGYHALCFSKIWQRDYL
jgi:hypothetical protein